MCVHWYNHGAMEEHPIIFFDARLTPQSRAFGVTCKRSLPCQTVPDYCSVVITYLNAPNRFSLPCTLLTTLRVNLGGMYTTEYLYDRRCNDTFPRIMPNKASAKTGRTATDTYDLEVS